MQERIRNIQGGYIGVLMCMLFSVLIIGYLYIRWWNTPEPVQKTVDMLQPLTASGTVPTTRREMYQADIDAAEKLQKEIEHKSVVMEEVLME